MVKTTSVTTGSEPSRVKRRIPMGVRPTVAPVHRRRHRQPPSVSSVERLSSLEWGAIRRGHLRQPVASPSVSRRMAEQNLLSFVWSRLRPPPRRAQAVRVRERHSPLHSPPPPRLSPEALQTRRRRREPGALLLRPTGGVLFCNTSPPDLKKLVSNQDHTGESLRANVQGISPSVRAVFESFELYMTEPACIDLGTCAGRSRCRSPGTLPDLA